MNLSALGLVKGQTFKLCAEDFSNVPRHKSDAAQVGMAIDAHIKKYLLPKGVTVPDDRYAPYDFMFEGMSFDIKSFTSSTVTVSDREMEYASIQIENGKDVIYAVFEQHGSGSFKFKGFTSCMSLLEDRKFKPSRFDTTEFFFVSSAKYL